ncbi:MAG: GNAT family N-acetyltransferase [bacterium]
MRTTFDFTTQEKIIFTSIYNQILETQDLSWPKLRTILHKFPKNGNSIYSKDELIAGFRELDKEGLIDLQKNSEVLQTLRLKPTRTISGVATVTVLTKPYPCPGECIFCPNDIRMPKSYLSDEPGAQRAERNNFDPYLQTYRRLKALYSIGHSVDKVEVIILGGTWSFYPERYQIWFIKRIFEALNEFSLGVDHTDEVELFLGSSKLIPEKYGKNWLSRGEIVTTPPLIKGAGGNLEQVNITSNLAINTTNVATSQLQNSPARFARTPFAKGGLDGVSIEVAKERSVIVGRNYLPYNPELKEKARKLRTNLTLQEKKLWQEFFKSLDFSVLKQRPIENFIVDFYIPKVKLAVELDGFQHSKDFDKKYDLERTKALLGLGVSVLRFTNNEVEQDFEEVKKLILKIVDDIELQGIKTPPLAKGAGGNLEQVSQEIRQTFSHYVKAPFVPHRSVGASPTCTGNLSGSNLADTGTTPPLAKGAGGNLEDNFLSNATQITTAKPTTYNLEVTKIIKETRGKLIEDYESATWEELELQQQINETAKCRNVGLVIETRPDKISPKEVIRIRRLGCTKTQIGIQSLNDEVLDLNHRGHHVQETRYAFKLLRQAGLKIHGHWMANLYGSTPEKDIEDYQKLFSDPDFCPDELKVYPCSLLETAELMDYYKKGLWKPYSFEDLLEVVSKVIAQTPEYCRLSRVIRDIPGGDIVVGNKLTNFREYAEKELDRQGVVKKDIRSREIKGKVVLKDDLSLKIIEYPVQIGVEQFLQFVTEQNQIAGFLRLSLPNYEAHPFMPELSGCAIIREVHVYGGAVSIGQNDSGKAQHLGLGTELIEKAKEIAEEKGYSKIAVISAIGTREYYKKRGFELEGLYQVCSI